MKPHATDSTKAIWTAPQVLVLQLPETASGEGAGEESEGAGVFGS